MNKLRGFAAAAAVIAVTLVAGCSGSDTASQAGNGTTGASPSGKPVRPPARRPPSAGRSPPAGREVRRGWLRAGRDRAAQRAGTATWSTAVTRRLNTLNSADGITLFAPTNDAFAKIPKATLAKVLADKKTLSGILTYHVVGERRAPLTSPPAPCPRWRAAASPSRRPATRTP